MRREHGDRLKAIRLKVTQMHRPALLALTRKYRTASMAVLQVLASIHSLEFKMDLESDIYAI